MKVVTYGNILNNAWYLTRFLQRKGVQAEMFLDDTTPSGQNYPWWEHPELDPADLPPWLHYHRGVTVGDLRSGSGAFRSMAAAFGRADVALVSSWGPILAEAAGLPSVFFSHGSDVSVAHTRREAADAVRRVLAGRRPGVRDLVTGLRQRRALQHVDAVAILMGFQINNYLRPLGLLPKTVRARLVWDVEAYHVQPEPALTARYAGYDVVYFMPTRHVWKSVWGDLKGNDKFIRAFARFVHARRPNVRLVCVDKGQDVAASRELVRRLGIGDWVEFVPEMNKDRMREYYGLPNAVIVDQFWHDDWRVRFPADTPTPRLGFGAAGLEALSAARPLISIFYDHDFYDGASPPILDAFREDEILRRIEQSFDMGAAGRAALGARGHDFVMRYHDWSTTIDMYIRLLEDVLRARRDGRPFRAPVPVT